MYELRNRDYNKILPLLKDISHSRALIFSVVEGNSEGRIFVDNIETPKTAYIESEFSYLVGFEDNDEFNKNICNYIFHDKIPNSNDKELILFTSSNKWEKINSLFKEKGCIKIERKLFTFNIDKYKEIYNSKNILIEDLILTPINKNFVNQYDAHHDIIQFPSKFGFCIVNEKEIISECISVAIGGNEAEISISTKENFRQKGYATRATIAFINHCIDKNITPNWSCWPFRKESINLAHKLGFDDKEDIPAIYWSENM